MKKLKYEERKEKLRNSMADSRIKRQGKKKASPKHKNKEKIVKRIPCASLYSNTVPNGVGKIGIQRQNQPPNIQWYKWTHTKYRPALTLSRSLALSRSLSG
jgi:hypothetical protein